MTYIRDPRNPLIWESDGVWDGKFRANDGTLHNTPEEVRAWEEQLAALAAQPSSPQQEGERVSALVEASKNLLEACYQADAAEELSEHIDGSLLDAVRDALAAAPTSTGESPFIPPRRPEDHG